ncbi:ArsR/SmtB family transcription factor [Streptomyces xylophagus]|uniref:ArsR/SmtB family transcription factor n=1 Tax=Streptomyces xylophagus TaxID=285514 RepID=UPI0005B824AA|nr:helix-turn-helix domain-containing protein [Streptomyces xylophagus]
MTSKETRAITDLGTLKAFAHPLRLKLYRALYVARTATASQLADQVDEAVSLVSYHLRKLAEHGLIEEAEQQSGDGRERWWQPAAEGLTVRHEDMKDAPEKLAAQGVLTRTLLEQRVDLYRRHLDESESWSDEWRSAGFESEYLPRLTAPELAELQHELDTLIKKYQVRGRAAEQAGDTQGRENVAIHLYGFPFRV